MTTPEIGQPVQTRLGTRSGVVVAVFADGEIVRVQWDGETRRGDAEAGENPRKRYPYVSDVGAPFIVPAERVISKDLRRAGSRAVVSGRDIFVAKHGSTLETMDTVGPLERVGSIDAVSYTQGVVTITTLRVLIYSHAYPREFPLSELEAAQDYALSLFS